MELGERKLSNGITVQTNVRLVPLENCPPAQLQAMRKLNAIIRETIIKTNIKVRNRDDKREVS